MLYQRDCKQCGKQVDVIRKVYILYDFGEGIIHSIWSSKRGANKKRATLLQEGKREKDCHVEEYQLKGNKDV